MGDGGDVVQVSVGAELLGQAVKRDGFGAAVTAGSFDGWEFRELDGVLGIAGLQCVAGKGKGGGRDDRHS